MRIQSLAQSVQLQDLPNTGLCVVRALRRWVAAHKSALCPVAAMRAQLGCVRAAAHLHLLLEEVGAAWPEPFSVSPPCCPRLSHDEATLAEMLRLAEYDDRPGFDRLLADLLPGDARDCLFHSARVLSEVVPA
jgi:hypothetical protein